MARPPCLLILGGTTEGRKLAEAVVARWGDQLRLISSLAGRTDNPKRPPGEVRIGGFGGADGLADYLKAEGVDALVDATHPFAARISAHAAMAAARLGIPRLQVWRPEWRPGPGDRWTIARDAADAAAKLPGLGRRALLTVGGSDLEAFAGVEGVEFIVRRLTANQAGVIPGANVIAGQPPFREDQEEQLLRALGIDVVVTKNAGGRSGQAKLTAARTLGLAVLMIERPPAEDGDRVPDPDLAVEWIAANCI